MLKNNEDINFQKLSEEITNETELNILSKDDPHMYEIFRTFWDNEIYSKFVLLTQQNIKTNVEELLKLTILTKNAIKHYIDSIGNFQKSYSNYIQNFGFHYELDSLYKYFEEIIYKNRPLTETELNTFIQNTLKFKQIILEKIKINVNTTTFNDDKIKDEDKKREKTKTIEIEKEDEIKDDKKDVKKDEDKKITEAKDKIDSSKKEKKSFKQSKYPVPNIIEIRLPEFIIHNLTFFITALCVIIFVIGSYIFKEMAILISITFGLYLLALFKSTTDIELIKAYNKLNELKHLSDYSKVKKPYYEIIENKGNKYKSLGCIMGIIFFLTSIGICSEYKLEPLGVIIGFLILVTTFGMIEDAIFSRYSEVSIIFWFILIGILYGIHIKAHIFGIIAGIITGVITHKFLSIFIKTSNDEKN